MTLKVFLLDDHEVVREGLRRLLESDADIEVVGEAGTAERALARVPALAPDVAILDVRLPDGSGIEVCRALRARLPELRCLILTSFDDDQALLAAVMAGASGFALKQIRGVDLVDTVKRVGRGESLLDEARTANLLEKMRQGSVEDQRMRRLSTQERRVLSLIAEGLTNKQIGDRLYLAEKTVKNYVSNMLAKLGMERRTEAAAYAARLEASSMRPK